MVGGLKNRFTRSLTQVISANDTDKDTNERILGTFYTVLKFLHVKL